MEVIDMIKLIGLLSKAFGILLAIVTAFGVGWMSCATWLITMLHHDTEGQSYRRPSKVSYRDYY
jgi:hypothetical protein